MSRASKRLKNSGPKATNEKCSPLSVTIEEMTSSNTQVPSLQYGYTLQARTAHCLLGVTARDHTFSLQKQLPSTFKSWKRGIHFPWEGSREPFSQLSGFPSIEMQTQVCPNP